MTNVRANWMAVPGNKDQPIGFIPVGSEFILSADFYDNVGRKFTAGNMESKVYKSRSDLIDLKMPFDNNTFAIATKKGGNMVLKIWNEGYKQTVDFIKLRLEQSIVPLSVSLYNLFNICLFIYAYYP